MFSISVYFKMFHLLFNQCCIFCINNLALDWINQYCTGLVVSHFSESYSYCHSTGCSKVWPLDCWVNSPQQSVSPWHRSQNLRKVQVLTVKLWKLPCPQWHLWRENPITQNIYLICLLVWAKIEIKYVYAKKFFLKKFS